MVILVIDIYKYIPKNIRNLIYKTCYSTNMIHIGNIKCTEFVNNDLVTINLNIIIDEKQ